MKLNKERREFIKKLPYIAPIIQTFILSETKFKDEQNEDGEENEGRKRGRISPHNRGRGRGRNT